MRNECNIIGDILTLYVENMVSSDTASFVEEHLEHCAECREKMESMKNTEVLTVVENIAESEILPLKQFRKKWTKRKVLMIVITVLITAAILLSGFYLLFAPYIRVSSEQVEVETEFQYSEANYLNQNFVLHFRLKNGKSLFAKNVEFVFKGGECVGSIIDLRTAAFELIPNPDNYTYGYGNYGMAPPDESFDFTIEVRYNDKTVTYSMRDEGLFEKQDNVVRN